jgi:hypothetical protein
MLVVSRRSIYDRKNKKGYHDGSPFCVKAQRLLVSVRIKLLLLL